MSHAWPGIHGIDGRRDRGPARQPDPRAGRAQVALRRAAGAGRAARSHPRRERRGVGRAPRVRAAARVAHHRAPRGARRHDQGRARSLRGDGGDRAHPRPRPQHRVRLEPGRLHAPLPVLRHRHARASPATSPPGEIVLQYLVARAAAPPARRRATWCSWAWASRWTTSTRCWPRSDRLTDEGAPRLAARNVTVSTSGVLPGMRALPAREPRRTSRCR